MKGFFCAQPRTAASAKPRCGDGVRSTGSLGPSCVKTQTSRCRREHLPVAAIVLHHGREGCYRMLAIGERCSPGGAVGPSFHIASAIRRLSSVIPNASPARRPYDRPTRRGKNSPVRVGVSVQWGNASRRFGPTRPSAGSGAAPANFSADFFEQMPSQHFQKKCGKKLPRAVIPFVHRGFGRGKQSGKKANWFSVLRTSPPLPRACAGYRDAPRQCSSSPQRGGNDRGSGPGPRSGSPQATASTSSGRVFAASISHAWQGRSPCPTRLSTTTQRTGSSHT